MKVKMNAKIAARQRRKKHIRKVVRGTAQRPRLIVYRSLKQIYAQLVDDQNGKVLTGLSSRSAAVREAIGESRGKIAVSLQTGKAIAAKARELGIERVVFDRNGYLYHGRIKAVADGAREGGLIL